MYLLHAVLPPVGLHLLTLLQCRQQDYLPGLCSGCCLAFAVRHAPAWNLQLSLVVMVQQAACDARLDLLLPACELCLTACTCIKDCIKDSFGHGNTACVDQLGPVRPQDVTRNWFLV